MAFYLSSIGAFHSNFEKFLVHVHSLMFASNFLCSKRVNFVALRRKLKRAQRRLKGENVKNAWIIIRQFVTKEKKEREKTSAIFWRYAQKVSGKQKKENAKFTGFCLELSQLQVLKREKTGRTKWVKKSRRTSVRFPAVQQEKGTLPPLKCVKNYDIICKKMKRWKNRFQAVFFAVDNGQSLIPTWCQKERL